MQENIIIGIDASGADEGGDLILRKMDQIKASADSTGRSIDKMATGGGNIKNMGGEVDSFTRSMRNANASVYGQGKAWMGVGNAADMAGVKVKNQAQQVAAAEREHRKMLTALGAVEKQYDRDTHAAKKYADQLDLIAKAQREGRLSPTKAAYYAQKIENARDEPMRSPGGHGSQSGLMREGLTVIRELINGNYTRLAGSLTLLAQYSGLMGKAVDSIKGAGTVAGEAGAGGFSILRIALLAIPFALAALVAGLATASAAMGRAANFDAKALDLNLQSAGRSSVITGEQLRKMSGTIASSFGLSREASLDMARGIAANGTITSGQIQGVMEASALLATTMKGDLKGATELVGDAMTRLAVGDVTALDTGFTTLSSVQKENIRVMIEHGNTVGAQQALLAGLKGSIDDQSGVSGAFGRMKNSIAESMIEFGRSSGLTDALTRSMDGLAQGFKNIADWVDKLNSGPGLPEWFKNAQKVMGGDSIGAGMDLIAGRADRVQLGAATAMGPVSAQGLIAGVYAGERSRGSDYNRDGTVQRSYSGATGRMQVMGDTARNPGYGIAPSNGSLEDTARVGREKIQKLYTMFGNDAEKAFAAYNMGEGALRKHIAIRQKAGLPWDQNFTDIADARHPNAGRDTAGYVKRAMGALGSPGVAAAESDAAFVSGYGRDIGSKRRLASQDPRAVIAEQYDNAVEKYSHEKTPENSSMTAAQRLAMARGRADQERQTALRDLNQPRTNEQAQRAFDANNAGRPRSEAELARQLSEARGKQFGNAGNVAGPNALDKETEAQIRGAYALKEARTKAYANADFLQGLKNETAAASMLPLEAEKYNALQKARLIQNNGEIQDMTALDAGMKKLVEDELHRKNLAEQTRNIKQATQGAEIEGLKLSREASINNMAVGEARTKALMVEQALWPTIAAGIALGISPAETMESIEYKRLQHITEINVEEERHNQLVKDGLALALQYGGPGAKDADFRQGAGTRRAALDAARQQNIANPNSNFMTDAIYKSALAGMQRAEYESANYMVGQFTDAIDTIAGHFGGSMGKVLDGLSTFVKGMNAAATGKGDKSLFGGIAGLADSLLGGSKVKDAYSATSQNQTGSLAKMLGASTQNFKSLGADMRNIFGKNGNFSQGLGSILGKAGAGVQAGDMVNSIAKMIGFKKFSKTGAEVGGAIGSFIPIPGGQFIGAAIGGTVGSLFKSSKYGGATISGKDGAYSVGAATGNDKAGRGAAGVGAANSVMGGLQSIISAIGGSASIGGFGSFNIGQYKKDWRVNTDGGALGGKHVTGHLMSFKTEEEAIAYAMKEAIKKGAIKGLSAASNRVLTGAKDPTTVVSAVAQYEQLASALLKVTDPAKGAIDEFTRGFRTMNDSLKAAGYTAAELGKVEQLYAAQRKELMKQLTAPYRDLIEGITNGPNSGKSIALQYQDAKSKYNADVAAPAGSIKAEDFTKAAQSFFDLSQKMFGSTTEQFAADRNSIVAGTNAQIDHVNAVGPPELLNAITTGAAETVNQLTQANTLLARIAEAMGVAGAGSAAGRASLYKLSLSENY